jgi:hypothetical protein
MLFQSRGDIEKSVDYMDKLPKAERVKFMQALWDVKVLKLHA